LVDLATPVPGDEGFIHFQAGLTFAVPAFSEGDGRGLGGHKAEPQQRMGLSQIYSSEINSGISQPSVHAGFNTRGFLVAQVAPGLQRGCNLVETPLPTLSLRSPPSNIS